MMEEKIVEVANRKLWVGGSWLMAGRGGEKLFTGE
jgi:hypothetical protein